MPHYKVAHVRDQDVEYLLLPVESSFGQKTDEEQRAFVEECQSGALASELQGAIVVVWEDDKGHTQFRSPLSFRAVCNDWTLRRVLAGLNQEIAY